MATTTEPEATTTDNQKKYTMDDFTGMFWLKSGHVDHCSNYTKNHVFLNISEAYSEEGHFRGKMLCGASKGEMADETDAEDVQCSRCEAALKKLLGVEIIPDARNPLIKR